MKQIRKRKVPPEIVVRFENALKLFNFIASEAARNQRTRQGQVRYMLDTWQPPPVQITKEPKKGVCPRCKAGHHLICRRGDCSCTRPLHGAGAAPAVAEGEV